MSTDIQRGEWHSTLLSVARGSQHGIAVLPSLMHAMLTEEGWREIIRAKDGKPFKNKTISEWVLGKPWKGLAFPNWETLYAMLGQDITHGAACLELLQKHGAPAPKKVEAAHLIATAEAHTLPKNGQVGNGRSFDNVKATPGGNSQEYLARRLRRDHPKIFAKLETYPSVRAAAIDAGIVKTKSTLDQLNVLWAKASPIERKQFLEAIGARRL